MTNSAWALRTDRRQPNGSVIAVVEKVSGATYIQHRGRTKAAVVVSERVFEGDEFTTRQGRIHLRCKDGSYLEVGENTHFQIERLRFKPGKGLPTSDQFAQFDEAVIWFESGIIRLTAPDIHPHSRFVVRNTTAIIRLNEPSDLYFIQPTDDPRLAVKVLRGSIQFTNIVTNDQVELKNQQSALLQRSGFVSRVGTSLGIDQIEALKARTRL